MKILVVEIVFDPFRTLFIHKIRRVQSNFRFPPFDLPVKGDFSWQPPSEEYTWATLLRSAGTS